MMRIIPIPVLLGILLIAPAYGASNLQVLNYSSYTNSNGLPVVVGEIVNDGKEPVKSVEVKVSFMDDSGQVIDSGEAVTAAAVIPAGQKSPFMIVGSVGYSDSITSYELQIMNFARAQNKPVMLQIVSTGEFSDGVSEVSIIGEVSNLGEDAAANTKVHATFYDDSGRVIGYSSTSPEPTTIEPNGKASFGLKIHERVPVIQSFTLFAESDQYSTLPFGVQDVNNPLEVGSKVRVSKLGLVDQAGSTIGSAAPGERVWIKSDLKNKLSIEQEFTYIVQIKDKHGYPVTINWVDGVMTPDMSFAPSLSWVPEDEGVYFAEIFVWHSMDNPVPLSSSIRTIILLVRA